ncbi:MAG: glycerate kinase [Porticoccaceae bacterium]|nr:MAG: glycerate kinase [Porticoccaceae bacterium]
MTDVFSSNESFDPKKLLTDLFQTAVAAADPKVVLPGFLDSISTELLAGDGNRKVVVIGAGKAAAAMASSLESVWEGGALRGLVVTAYGHAMPCEQIEVIEAAHPVPDQNSEIAAQRILNLVADLNENDLVICLLSGGGSSLLALPAPGITLADKQQINKALLKSGADIHEINCVRKHLSAIKGGRLAMACAPAKLMTFAISDVTGNVPGGDPAVIASGPTVADPTTRQQALAILDKYHIAMSDAVHQWLSGSESETPKSVSEHSEFQVIATARQSLQAAAKQVEKVGLTALMLGGDLTGESSELAKAHAELARSILLQGQPVKAPCVILSGGETTVQVTGNGRGGRNTEYLLNLADELKGQQGVYALAADTDGIDGSGDNAGAVLSPDSWQRAQQLNLNIIESLENNDSYSYFEALGDLVVTGPTCTNVNDFRAILLWPENDL